MRIKIFAGMKKAAAAVLAAAFLAGCGARDVPVSQADDAADRQQADNEKERQAAEADGTPERQETQTPDTSAVTLADGVYTVTFDTDSSMFHLNESCEGRARLTVEEGAMTVHVPLVSKSIVNLFPGSAAEAQAADASAWLQPVEESVTYTDGYTETVYAFDVPVPAVGVEFALALIGTKGKWYDHTVCVTDPRPLENEGASGDGQAHASDAEASGIAPGTYRVEVALAGGSGRADIESPALVTVSDEGIVVMVAWSSPYYDYMIVDGVTYEPVNDGGNSVFEIPVAAFDTEIAVTANTVAMSVPHEIAYTLVLDAASAVPAE